MPTGRRQIPATTRITGPDRKRRSIWQRKIRKDIRDVIEITVKDDNISENKKISKSEIEKVEDIPSGDSNVSGDNSETPSGDEKKEEVIDIVVADKACPLTASDSACSLSEIPDFFSM